MRPSLFKQAQMIGMLKGQEDGARSSDVYRNHGNSTATFDKFKAEYHGIGLSDAWRLKGLEDENARPKKLPAEHLFDKAILKDVAAAMTGNIRGLLNGNG